MTSVEVPDGRWPEFRKGGGHVAVFELFLCASIVLLMTSLRALSGYCHASRIGTAMAMGTILLIVLAAYAAWSASQDHQKALRAITVRNLQSVAVLQGSANWVLTVFRQSGKVFMTFTANDPALLLGEAVRICEEAGIVEVAILVNRNDMLEVGTLPGRRRGIDQPRVSGCTICRE